MLYKEDLNKEPEWSCLGLVHNLSLPVYFAQIPFKVQEIFVLMNLLSLFFSGLGEKMFFELVPNVIKVSTDVQKLKSLGNLKR